MSKNKIAIIGEAYGENEEREQTAFVGASGYLLTKMLEEAGIHRADCFITNVFNRRPQNNKIEALCGTKKEGIKGYPALIKGKHIREEFEPELLRLGNELTEINPNLILALGNTACWAMLGKTFISKLRGTTSISDHTISGFKVLPTYHPAAISRQWELRPTVIIDLMKAKREAEYPDIRRPKRQIWIEPTLEDIHDFQKRFIDRCKILSVDIETSGSRITCMGFAPSPRISIVIPFDDARKLGRNYWPTQQIEKEVWAVVSSILGNSRYPKLFQNGAYDIAFLWRAYGIKTVGAEHDTMLLHHALQPESLKSLGFLGSIYTDEGSWKHMRHVATIKSDE